MQFPTFSTPAELHRELILFSVYSIYTNFNCSDVFSYCLQILKFEQTIAVTLSLWRGRIISPP